MPAIVLTLGGIFLPDTPNSLIQRGKDAEGRAVLIRIRGTTDVDEEFNDIKDAVKQSESVRPNTFMKLTAMMLESDSDYHDGGGQVLGGVVRES